MTKKRVLILGADGLVGQTVFSYFKELSNIYTVGTSRKKGLFEKFEIMDFEKYFKKIIKIHGKVDFVINCIGETRKNASAIDLIEVNSLFPQRLASFLAVTKTSLIHISSDAVYSSNDIRATEVSVPSPETYYGASKLLGEPNTNNSLTIRTSIIGTSKNRVNGLLDRSRSSSKSIEGYTNQNWSGCTTLQFAIFCDYLINNWTLSKRKFKNIVNFAPIGSISKYQILKAAQKLGIIKVGIKKMKAKQSVTRTMSSAHFDMKDYSRYTCDVSQALVEMIEYGKKNN